jgi:hypothetical protein
VRKKLSKKELRINYLLLILAFAVACAIGIYREPPATKAKAPLPAIAAGPTSAVSPCSADTGTNTVAISQEKNK